MQFERRILQRNTPAWEIAFLGAVLTCVYGGLRFADAQRLPFRSFVLDVRTFRGVCDRTKTSHKGQPWGLLKCGLLSKGQVTWVSRYLMTLDDIWAQTGRESIDFLFFTVEDTNISPMSYAEALRTLTEMLDFAPFEVWNTPRYCRNKFHHAFHEEHFACVGYSGARNL